MFRKIQSYVTPILLSYVDKYIKDFKTEDTQVSLWGGSVSLHNLELRPDIIQKELNLPFSLSSGHIHELLIQVPWMKIVSEPIVVTINTIECVLKIVDGKQTIFSTIKTTKPNEELDAPPGYVQSLVNRIVSNIAFRCHNIILKYVEEDIVVSVNIKQFHLDNVDGNWVPTFAEMTLEDLHTRKLVKLSDITLCLDKRNAAGKIETYLEPLLYKCELELRLDSTYSGILNKRPMYTKISVHSPKLEFGFSYQQIPMILRIITLVLSLKQKKLGSNEGIESSTDSARHTSPKISKPLLNNPNASDEVDYNESWSGWMWSFVQPFPLGYGDEQDSSLSINPVILFSINFDKVTFSFKVPDIAQDVTGIYNNQRKFRYNNICTLKLKSVSCETSSHNFERFCFRGGVKHIVLYPENACACGISDIELNQQMEQKVYFKSLSNNNIDDEAQLHWPEEYDSQNIIESMKEEDMLLICPAFAFSYIYHLTIPDESNENMNSVGTDLEYSNFKEDIAINAVFGPFDAYVCAGMVHRLSLLKIAADAYDYAPYYISKPLTKPSELPPPTTDDYDALSEFVPKCNIKITAFKSKFHVAIWDHHASVKCPSFNETTSGVSLLNRRKISLSTPENISSQYEKLKNMPSFLFEVETITSSISYPIYPNRLTYVTCQLPDPPSIMLDSCYKYVSCNVTNMQCFLVHKVKSEKNTSSSFQLNLTSDDDSKAYNEVNIPFITQCSFHMSIKHLLLRDYWSRSGISTPVLYDDYNFNMDNITICGTLAKIYAAYHIFMGTLPQNESQKSVKSEKSIFSPSKSQSILMKTSLLNDAFGNNEMVHLDINFEGLSVRSVYLLETQTHRMVLNAVKIFAIGLSKGNPEASNVNQVWIVSAPESKNPLSAPLVKAVMQLSTDEQYQTFLTVKVEEWSFVMDPLLCQWSTYSYKFLNEKSQTPGTPVIETNQSILQKRHSRRSLDEIVNRIGGSSRTLNRLSLGQSSSDREKDYIHGVPNPVLQPNINDSKEAATISASVEEPKADSLFFDNIIRRYFEQKNLAIFIEIEVITVYFPIEPVSALDFHFVADAINGSILKNTNNINGEKVFVTRLPNILLKSSSLKQNLLSFCIYGLPVKLPSDIWDQTKISYPWTVAIRNFSCYTLSQRRTSNDANLKVHQIDVLKPLSSDLTISFTPKLNFRKNTKSNDGATAAPSKSNLSNTENAGCSSEEDHNKTVDCQDASNNTTRKVNSKSSTSKQKEYRFSLNKFKPTSQDDIIENLTSIGICIHIDTESVFISLNEEQMILMNSIIHGVRELMNVLVNIYSNNNTIYNVENIPCNIQPLQDSTNYYAKQRNLSMSDNIIIDNVQEEDFSKDSDLVESSCDIANTNKIDGNKENNENSTSSDTTNGNTFTISAWVQWTVSRVSFKIYASSDDLKSKSKHTSKQLKLVFTADDIVSSLDIQHEYLKWSMKVLTAGIHHYKRTSTHDSWELGDFCGIILKGRELLKQVKSSGENSFVFINVTRAKRSSVHNKWGDVCKVKPKLQASDDSYISEIEVSLQALDIILNMKSLEPFSFLLSSLFYSPIKCHTVNTPVGSDNNALDYNTEKDFSCRIAKSWDSRKLALCYFDGYLTRIIMPVVGYSDNVYAENVLILQSDRINLFPIADNPICRSPLRPDLYQQAARTEVLNIPGSELEDRQCEFTVKGINLYTTQWQQIKNSYASEIQSQPIVSENPALQWNSTLSKQPSSMFQMNIIEKVDIYMVLALSIFHQSELVCGPTIDVNIVTDIEVYMSVPQFKLVKMIIDECLGVIENFKNKMPNINTETFIDCEDTEKFLTSLCPYYKFINEDSLKSCRENIDFNIERNTPTLSVDTGIASDITSNFTCTSKSSPKYMIKTTQSSKSSDRLHTLIDYFDIFVTFGKISLNLFEIFSHNSSHAAMNENFPETKDDKGKKVVPNFYSRPLLYVILHQPNFSYTSQHFITKSQFSIYHVSISLDDDCIHENLPKANDFLIDLFETKPGIPDSSSGISPAFLTINWQKSVGKKDFMKINIKCPIRITSSLERISKLNKIIKLLFNFTDFKNDKSVQNTSTLSSNLLLWKKFLSQYSSIDISMSQLVFAVIVQDQIDFELLFSLSSYKHNIVFNTRPEKITNLGLIDSLTVSLRKTDDRQTKILVNPWTFGFDISMIWEAWQNLDNFSILPIIKIFIQTDRLLIDLSSEHIKILQGIFNYWNKNYDNIMKETSMQNEYNNNVSKPKTNVSRKSSFWNQIAIIDQHYKDDLRAGAFKFIHGGVGYPLAYQVFIRSNGLIWRYPQPRTITRVHSFPVSFEVNAKGETNTSFGDSIVCTLEYYSEVTNNFHYYAKFYIKQDNRVKLDHSKFDHCTVLSSMWRVVMHLNESDIIQKRTVQNQISFNKNNFFSFDNLKLNNHVTDPEKEIHFPVSPQTLAACLRIDSYFTPNLVPKLQIALEISSAELNLYNHYRQRSVPPLLDSLKLYQLDGCLLSPHIFCTVALMSAHLQSNIWDENTAIVKVDSDLRCDIINGSDMLLDNVINCNDFSANLWFGEGYDNAIGSVIHAQNLTVRGGPQHTHMLYTSSKLWHNTLSTNTPLTPTLEEANALEKRLICYDCTNKKSDMLIMKYVICNDTNMSLKFGQIETKESIILESRKCHLYSWRMPNMKHLLKLTINLGFWKFSEGIHIEKPGIQIVELKHEQNLKPVTIIVLVENLSPIQLCVTFMGQLIVMNILPFKFDLKLYHKKTLQLPNVPIEAGVRSPSLLFDTNADFTIRLHNSSTDSGWSGDIPLKECLKGNTPWLVKVPVKSEMQFISIWCRITKDNKHRRTLITLSPLYIIRSHLPTKISVKLESEKCSQTSDYSIEGKGSTQFITCPGTTVTKHNLTINNIENANISANDKIPLHYDLVDQLNFFPSKEDVVDIDAILCNIKQWCDNQLVIDCEWPYIFSEDGFQWNPIEHQHSTDIIVRYLPAIRYVDSMILDMSPWALFGNCTGVQVHLHGPNGEELCTINHRDVTIPPPVLLKETFFLRISFTSESYLSGPLYVSSTALGPYEQKPHGCIAFDSSSTFKIDCGHSVCIFSLAYEIKQNISIFRLSSNYLFINQLPDDVMVLPIATYDSLSEVVLPQNVNDFTLKIPTSQNNCVGIPINKFYILSSQPSQETSERTEENLTLYIYLSYSLDVDFSCPIRIDQFSQRRPVSLKSIDKSIPIVLSCQEYRGQVYIMSHKDTAPQFLIINKANMTIAIAQVLKEFVTMDTYNYDTKQENLPKNVVEECWESDWHCVIQPGEEVYYTMPTQSVNYPELFSGNSSGVEENLYLTFAYIENQNGCNSYIWSVPVDVSTHSLEKFVKLPGYVEDIKVMVENHCFATTVTVNNVTQDDISASDIRQRLSISIPTVLSDNETNVQNSSEASVLPPQTPIEVVKYEDIDDIEKQENLVEEVLDSDGVNSLDSRSVTTFSNSGFRFDKFLKLLKATVIFDSVNIFMTINKDTDEICRSSDVFSLICDDVVITSDRNHKGFEIVLTIEDLQIDNPLFPNGGFDFHVVIIKQSPRTDLNSRPVIDWKPSLMSQITNISNTVKSLRQNCLVSCDANIEVWKKCSIIYSGLYDLKITIGPTSLYLEDTYISTMLDYVTNFVPTYSPVVCTHINQMIKFDTNEDGGLTFINIPEYIIWEGLAIAHPIKCKRLQIQPLNILLSLHSSTVLYLALDHSPLQFAKFERINILTSSYRLGHALTMHYLSEAMFGAGWVVGSLEILGSPGGLARRVSAGLRDLVREPCRGLMRGPWGFLVGMTHGSASLLKHLTQGTVESMSMVMGSVARNLDRLSLDEEHMRRTERARRHRPEGLVQALTRGLQGLGLSLLGAIGGIAHGALIAGYEQRGGPAAVAAGLSRGLMGVLTKPLSATADFLALTGQGLLCQAGWDQHPTPRWKSTLNELAVLKNENFRMKLGNTFVDSSLLYICQGVNKDTGLNVTLVVTNKWMILLDTYKDKVLEMVELEWWRIIKSDNKTGELHLGLRQAVVSNQASTSNAKLEPELQMDPALRARIAAYVGVVEDNYVEEKMYRLVLSQQHSSHCATMILFARLHSLNQGFPVL